jgi:uncharacterized protein YceK
MALRRTGIFLVVLAALSAQGGCATSGSLAGKDGCKVYGGTRLDATIIAEGLAPAPDVAKTAELEGPVLLWAACCGLVDLPFSFLADTALLPITVPLAARADSTESAAAGQAPKKDKAVTPTGSSNGEFLRSDW